MNPVMIGFAAAVVISAVGFAVWQRVTARRAIQKLNAMLDAAMDGSFAEQIFDESLLSATESRLAEYLSASEVSSRNLAAEKDKIKELIADISHQTKTPISNLLLYTQLLAERDLSREDAQCVSALNDEAEKLSFLIASLVKLSRLETGIVTLHPAVADIATVLNEVRRQYEAKAGDKGIMLRVEPTDERALFDPKWTAEAVANLVDNAIKYTPGGEVSVSVTPYDLFCRIDVRDTGTGISEDEQAKVFGRFYRSESAAYQEGVGIGLYLARRIIEDQGGYIKVGSKPGAGSTFSVFLPRGN